MARNIEDIANGEEVAFIQSDNTFQVGVVKFISPGWQKFRILLRDGEEAEVDRTAIIGTVIDSGCGDDRIVIHPPGGIQIYQQ